jgi:hypothetical protein
MVPDWVVYLFMFILVIIFGSYRVYNRQAMGKRGVNKKNDKPD